MTPDQGAETLTAYLRNKIPFFFARIGDGAIECLDGRKGQTCDGERYSPELAVELRKAIEALKGGGAIFGDWRTAVAGSEPKYVPEWLELIGADRELLNYESLLLMRQSEALVNFYRAVKEDTRRKVNVGRGALETCKLLGCSRGINTPMTLGEDSAWLLPAIETMHPEVILFGAGMAGLIAVVKYWQAHPGVTCIHLGSALDPLFRQSRQRQLSTKAAREMFKGLL